MTKAPDSFHVAIVTVTQSRSFKIATVPPAAILRSSANQNLLCNSFFYSVLLEGVCLCYRMHSNELEHILQLAET